MCQFPLFETIAIIDGNIQNIEYHQARYHNACRNYLKNEPVLNLAEIINVPVKYQSGLVRCKVEYNSVEYQIQYFPYQAKRIEFFQVMQCENLNYQFKYTDREIFANLPISTNSEVILLNDGKVSDCTIGNLLFLKNGKWFSPVDYLLKGTQLSRLLEKKRVELCRITADNLRDFEQVMMVNALNPFDLARALPIQAVRF